MIKISTVVLTALLALALVACGGQLATTTTVTQPVTTLQPAAPPTSDQTTTTTEAPTTTTESDLAAEAAWLKVTAPPMAGFVWFCLNVEAIATELSPEQMKTALETQVEIVSSAPAPTQRTQELSDQFTRVVAPVWALIKALDEGNQAAFEQALSVMSSQEYQSEATSFGQNLGSLAQDCGMYDQVMDWMQNGVHDDMSF